jgi:glutamine amidotransferase-like uncharacterized protein
MRISKRKSSVAYWFALSSALLWLLMLDTAWAEETKKTDAIRVAIYSGTGVTPGDAEQVKTCLPTSKGFDVTLITAKEIGKADLDKFDVLIHPGGSGSGQAKALGDDGRERVRQFVRRGGGYVGICAGAYLASAEYPWALKLIDARVIDDEHWARGVGKVTLNLPTEGQSALGTQDKSTEMHYENGPLLGPANQKNIPDFESLATFDTEIRKNNAPVGIMKGTTAIARGQFGDGRVVCFSTHPEKSRGKEMFVAEMVRWAAIGKSK